MKVLDNLSRLEETLKANGRPPFVPNDGCTREAIEVSMYVCMYMCVFCSAEDLFVSYVCRANFHL